MKKIFTLICFTGLLATGFAQSNRENDRDNNGNAYGKGYDQNAGYQRPNDRDRNVANNRYDERYSYTSRERDMEITRVNSEFDRQIANLQYQRMRPRERRRITSSLESQRLMQISTINKRFHEKRNRYGDYPQYDGRH